MKSLLGKLKAMLIAYSNQNSQLVLLKLAADSARKTATNSDMIAPVTNEGFWKSRIVTIDPTRPAGFLQTGQSVKFRFYELEVYKAAVADHT